MFDFNDRLIIVTGGTKGIGKAVSRAFLDCGGNVIAIYAGDSESAMNFQNSDTSGRLRTIKCDVSSYQEVHAFFEQLEKNGEKLDVLVNNAGIRKDSILGMMPPEDWQKVIDINLTGVFNMSKFAILNMMKQRRGRVINITSAGRNAGFEGQTNYSATKAGIVAFSKSLSREVSRRNITVNCVSPGFIETDLISSLPEETVSGYKKMITMRRFGKPEEVSPAVLFLASDMSSYITGSVIDVDGGL